MATANNPITNASPAWIEIFRAGDYRSQGKGLITREDLDRVVKNYDPIFHEAPVTVGHPADNLPAFGWIDRVALNGDVLVATEKQVDPQFNELRQAGRYKKRSASFYKGADGKVSGLRHVAYLGAEPPAVKGLKDVKFKDEGREFIEMSCGEESFMEKTVSEQIKEYIAGLFSGGNTTPQNFSEADARRIASETAAAAVTAAVTPLQEQIAAQKTALDLQATQFSEREAALAAAAIGQRATSAVTRLKAAGRWIPAYDVMGVPVVFGEMAKVTTTVEFGEGAAKKTTNVFDLMVDFLEGLPAIVPGGRTFTGAPTGTAQGSTGDALTDAAKARQKEKNISFSEALDQIAAEQPQLTRPGSAAGGTV